MASTVEILRAAQAGRSGERALFAAVDEFDAAAAPSGKDSAHLAKAKVDLAKARTDFNLMHSRLSGPVLALARVTPFVRVQVTGADEMGQAGIELAAAGEHLADVAAGVLAPADSTVRLKDALGSLKKLDSAASASVAALQSAESQIAPLASYRLIGPVGSARTTFFAKLPRIEQRVGGGDQALRALEDFLGAAAPHRFLVLSQNPNEIRPTGGYIGTIGQISSSRGQISLPFFEDTVEFLAQYPNVYVPEAQAPSVFTIGDSDQTFGNVNATPDWPTGARLAMKLWRQTGQPPVDGVVSITPPFLSRIVGVLGPVTVPSYDETVTASNLEARVDYWAHQNPGVGMVNRRGFLSELSRIVLQEALDAPASKWHALANAAASGFHQSEAMVWSSDPVIEAPVDDHGWDHAFPRASRTGDYFYDSEFEFEAKNGRGLRRVFQHTVTLRADGSGVASTDLALTNTQPFTTGASGYNIGSPIYVVTYGPSGAKLDTSSPAPYYAYEPPLNGHVAEGYFISPLPLTTARADVIWDVPHILRRIGDKQWEYRLVFPKLPAHPGDILKLSVTLPPHWRWKSEPPPTVIPLNTDVNETWDLVSP